MTDKMERWAKPADEKSIERAAAALKANGMEIIVAGNREEAKKRVLELIPRGAEVMSMTSVTLDTAGIWIIVSLPLHNKTGTPTGAMRPFRKLVPVPS